MHKRTSAAAVIAVTALTAILTGPVLARCDPGRSSISREAQWGIIEHANDGPREKFTDIGATVDNNQFPFIEPGSTSGVRIEMNGTYDDADGDGQEEYYGGARMVLEVRWGPTQGRSSSSTLWFYLTDENGGGPLFNRVEPLANFSVGDVARLKLHAHIHSTYPIAVGNSGSSRSTTG